MRITGAAVSAAYATGGLIGWLAFGLPGALLLFGLCAAGSLGLALLSAPLLERPPRADGGLGSRTHDDPPSDPPWWPGFEEDLRAYALGDSSRPLTSGRAAP
jgi:hypothetical protein